MTKKEQSEQNEARETLRGILKPGQTVYTILRHVSRSGMQRSISLLVQEPDGMREISYLVARAMDYKIDRDRGGIKAGGCGMDMGFSLVYNLGYCLYPDGYGCAGERCQSSDHTNGDRDYTRHESAKAEQALAQRVAGFVTATASEQTGHWHRDGGYAFRHLWL